MSGTQGDAQSVLARARELMTKQGAPMTTENLNRAMMMLTQQDGGAPSTDAPSTFDMTMDASLNEGRPAPRRGGNVMSPTVVEPEVRVNAGEGMTAGGDNMPNLRDRTMQANPNEQTGNYADQPGQRDTQARLLQNSGDNGQVEGPAAATPTQQGTVVQQLPPGSINAQGRAIRAEADAQRQSEINMMPQPSTRNDQPMVGMGMTEADAMQAARFLPLGGAAAAARGPLLTRATQGRLGGPSAAPAPAPVPGGGPSPLQGGAQVPMLEAPGFVPNMIPRGSAPPPRTGLGSDGQRLRSRLQERNYPNRRQ